MPKDSISRKTASILAGTHGNTEIEKAKPEEPVVARGGWGDPDAVALEALTIGEKAASLRPGGHENALHSQAVISAKAAELKSSDPNRTRPRTSQISQAELDRESGHPNTGGTEALTIAMRLNRRGEPK